MNTRWDTVHWIGYFELFHWTVVQFWLLVSVPTSVSFYSLVEWFHYIFRKRRWQVNSTERLYTVYRPIACQPYNFSKHIITIKLPVYQCVCVIVSSWLFSVISPTWLAISLVSYTVGPRIFNSIISHGKLRVGLYTYFTAVYKFACLPRWSLSNQPKCWPLAYLLFIAHAYLPINSTLKLTAINTLTFIHLQTCI